MNEAIFSQPCFTFRKNCVVHLCKLQMKGFLDSQIYYTGNIPISRKLQQSMQGIRFVTFVENQSKWIVQLININFFSTEVLISTYDQRLFIPPKILFLTSMLSSKLVGTFDKPTFYFQHARKPRVTSGITMKIYALKRACEAMRRFFIIETVRRDARFCQNARGAYCRLPWWQWSKIL